MRNAGRRTRRKRAWVLLSGGVDSSTCVAFYVQQKFSVQALFVDYGQLAARYESRAATAIARYYRVPLKKLILKDSSDKGAGLVVGRNAFLLFTGMMEIGDVAGLLGIAIHEGTNYYDCSSSFLKMIQSIVDGYTSGSIRVAAPFVDWDKREIWEYARSIGVPVELTYSCELGKAKPCGQCSSCKDLKALHASENVKARP